MSRSEKNLGTCCCCIPLRNGVLLIALITFLDSARYMFGLYTDDVRLTTGGFNPITRTTMGVLGVLGLFFSLGGITGCYDSNPAAVRSFWYFTLLRIFTMLFVLAVDHVSLSRCEQYRWKLYEPDEFNPTLSAIARANGCSEARQRYTSEFLFDILVNSYFSYVAWRLSEVLLLGPSYLILFEKEVVKQPVSYRSTGGRDRASASPRGPRASVEA